MKKGGRGGGNNKKEILTQDKATKPSHKITQKKYMEQIANNTTRPWRTFPFRKLALSTPSEL